MNELNATNFNKVTKLVAKLHHFLSVNCRIYNWFLAYHESTVYSTLCTMCTVRTVYCTVRTVSGFRGTVSTVLIRITTVLYSMFKVSAAQYHTVRIRIL